MFADFRFDECVVLFNYVSQNQNFQIFLKYILQHAKWAGSECLRNKSTLTKCCQEYYGTEYYEFNASFS